MQKCGPLISVWILYVDQFCFCAILHGLTLWQFGQELAEEHKNRSTFMKVGLSDRNTPTDNPPFYTLKTLMEKNGHDYIDYLKVDIEGAEYDSMGKFMDDFAEVDLPVGQFALEVHLRLDPDGPDFGFAKVSNFMERFESFGLRAVANEVNYGSADSPPRYIEVSLPTALKAEELPLTLFAVRLGKHK